jgi:hypothetical protein
MPPVVTQAQPFAPFWNSAFIPAIWDKDTVIPALTKTMVFLNPLDLSHSIISDKTGLWTKGSTLHIPRVANLGVPAALPDWNSGAAPTSPLAALAPTGVITDDATISIDQPFYKSFQVGKTQKRLSLYDIGELFLPKAAYSLAVNADSYFSELCALNSGYTTAPSLVGLDSLSDTEIKNALGKAKAMMKWKGIEPSDLSLVVCPGLYQRLAGIWQLASSDFRTAGTASSQISGQVGQIYGIPVYESNNLYTAAASGQTVVYNVLLHKSAVGFAIPKPDGSEPNWSGYPIQYSFRPSDALFPNDVYSMAMIMGGNVLPEEDAKDHIVGNWGIMAIPSDDPTMGS